MDDGRITVTLAAQETALLRIEGQPLDADVDLPADVPARFDVTDEGYKAPDRTPARQWVLAQIGYRPFGEPLLLDGVQDRTGVGVAAGTRVRINLDGQYDRVALDPRMAGATTGRCVVRLDGRVLADGIASDKPHPMSLHVRGARQLELVAPPAANGVTSFAWHRVRQTRR